MSDAQRQAELAVADFLLMRAQILGELSPEALSLVPEILRRETESRKSRAAKK